MKNTHSNIDQDIRERAVRVLESLMSDMLPGDTEDKIREWFGSGNQRAAKEEAFEKVFFNRVKEDLAPDESVYRSLEEIKRRLGFPEEKKRIPFRRVMLRAAAVLAPVLILAASVFLFVRPGVGDPGTAPVLAEIAVGVGEHKHIVLPDSSEIWLNESSRVVYPEDFTGDRTIALDGEAYFSVKNLDDSPFVVNAGGLSVKVVGTAFNVRAYETETSAAVTLGSGRVEVLADRALYTLDPLDRLELEKETKEVVVSHVGQGDVSSWRRKYLYFEYTPLDEVLTSIGQYFGVTMSLDREHLPLEQPVTIDFYEEATLDDVLYVLRRATEKFNYSIRGDSVLITR